MSKRDTRIISFRIEDGVITEVTERWPLPPKSVDDVGPAVRLGPRLTDPRDIEDAVARVANTPVREGGEEK